MTDTEEGLDLGLDALDAAEEVKSIPKLEKLVSEATLKRWTKRSLTSAPGIGPSLEEGLLRLGVETVGDMLRTDLAEPEVLLALPRMTEARLAGVWKHVAQDLGVSTDTLRKAVGILPVEESTPDAEYALAEDLALLRNDVDRLVSGLCKSLVELEDRVEVQAALPDPPDDGLAERVEALEKAVGELRSDLVASSRMEWKRLALEIVLMVVFVAVVLFAR